MFEAKKDTVLITTDEACEVYGCSRQRLYQFVSQGRLTPVISQSRVQIFDKADVEKLRDENLPYRRKVEEGRRLAEAKRKLD